MQARAAEDEQAAEDYNEAFGWIDWRSMEHEVIEAFAWQLDEGDELTYREDEDEGRVTPILNGVEYRVPLTFTGSDRYVMIHSLAEILKDRYEVFLEADSQQSDTHGVLVLPHAQAEVLRQRHAQWMKNALEELQPGLDGFSGLQVPWVGHEDAAPEFAAKRAKMDASSQRSKERRQRGFDAYAEDLRATERGELPASENIFAIKQRQHWAAMFYFAAAFVSMLLTISGLVYGRGTGWRAVVLLALAGSYHVTIATRMSDGWRPPRLLRWLPAVVLLVLLVSGRV